MAVRRRDPTLVQRDDLRVPLVMADLAEAQLLATDALAAGVAHELNNLLTALSLQVESLRDTAGEENAQVTAIDRVIGRGTDLGAELMAIAGQGGAAGWLPVADLLDRGFAYLRLLWCGRHLHLTVAGPTPAAIVPHPVAELAWRWALGYLSATAPRGCKAAIHLRRDGLHLLLEVGPTGADGAAWSPGTGMAASGSLRALRGLLVSVGGEAAVAPGPEPRIALWLPARFRQPRRTAAVERS